MARLTASRWFGGAGLVLALSSAAGCGLVPASEGPLQVSIQNTTDREARVELVEYDFETNQAGERMSAWPPLAAGGTMHVDSDLPSAESWTLMVNGIISVTSLDVARLAEDDPGEGPFYFAVVATEGGLETSSSRSPVGPGTTTAPVGTPP